jgi:cob(I)alamin adenosyltransferase
MGHRLSRITTRTGDGGETGLGDGTRVPKDSARIVALGEVDELNSAIGLLATEPMPQAVREALVSVQHDLFDLGGEVCIPGRRALAAEQIARVEQLVEALNAELPPLKEFILPGGSRAAAVAHLARTVCRRAERALVTLGQEGDVSETAQVYLNRLSDLLFVIARIANKSAGVPDVLWQHDRKR